MTDQQPNFEVDDELLSAYLDDELAGDERAAVEARLAVDPAAQRLLHELRLVSQSVQSLPQQNMGRDLSDTIVRLAREAKPVSTQSEPAQLGGSLPKIPIFGSKRAWFWASLALAAGLLIMFVHPGDERANKLPELARHDSRDAEVATNQPAKESAMRARRELEVTADRGAQPPPSVTAGNREPARPMPTSPAPTQSVGKLPSVANFSGSAGPPVATARPAAQKDAKHKAHALVTDGSSFAMSDAGQAPAGKIAQPSAPTGGAGAFGGDKQFASVGGGRASAERHDPLIVVRVVAKREAFHNKSYDELLAKNRIDIEPAALEKQSQAAEGRVTGLAEKPPTKSIASKVAAEQNLDMVLVDAPAAAIRSYLASLNKDSADYLGIAVDETAQPADRMSEKTDSNKKLSENLGRYARGFVPQVAKDVLKSRNNYYLYDAEPIGERASDSSSLNGNVGREIGGQDARRIEQLEPKQAHAESRGRARRLPTEQIANAPSGQSSASNSGVGGQVVDEARQKRKAEQKVEETTKSDAGNLHVLFVFSSEDASAPSASPNNPAK